MLLHYYYAYEQNKNRERVDNKKISIKTYKNASDVNRNTITQENKTNRSAKQNANGY